MSKLFTRNGDDGYTGVLGKGRLPKHHAIPEAVGTLDEASAALGWARVTCQSNFAKELILAVQRDLYHLMAEISASPENAVQFRKIDASRLTWLEDQIKTLEDMVQIPQDFIVPGDSPGEAALAIARTIVRRAERRVTQLFHQNILDNLDVLRYLNRLSSLIFALELLENSQDGKLSPTLAKNQ